LAPDREVARLCAGASFDEDEHEVSRDAAWQA
jgi:hypothetical protein